MGSVGYFWNEKLGQRQTGSLCPETSERNSVLSPSLFSGLQAKIQLCEFESRDAGILSLVHTPEYIKKVQTAYADGRRYLDSGDTRVTPDLFEQALLSASAGCEALDQIMANKLNSGFCAIRPPGHHANRYRAMGFCVFNNLAIAAKYAQANFGIGPVLIVDWDVHPGNGTQEIFWEDPTVFTLSFHQEDLFPESGSSDLAGRGDGAGFNRNVPLRANIVSEAYLKRFAAVVQEVAQSFRPQLLLIAAGFDAHSRDPAGQMMLTAEDFGKMTEILLTITQPYTSGKTLSLLEGGYNTAALKESVAAHCKALAELA